MNSAEMTNLILVLDPNFADSLESASLSAPVWVVDTAPNKQAYELLWNARPHGDHREIGAITGFHGYRLDDPVEALAHVLPQLETHHGDVEGDEIVFPKGFVLEVIGLSLSDAAKSILREFGFSSFVQIQSGFRAIK